MGLKQWFEKFMNWLGPEPKPGQESGPQTEPPGGGKSSGADYSLSDRDPGKRPEKKPEPETKPNDSDKPSTCAYSFSDKEGEFECQVQTGTDDDKPSETPARNNNPRMPPAPPKASPANSKTTESGMSPPKIDTSELAEKLDALLAQAEAQAEARSQALEEIQALRRQLAETIAQAVTNANANLPNRLAKAISEADTPAGNDIHSIEAKMTVHGDLLGNIRENTARAAEAAVQGSAAADRLSQAIETMQQANKAHVELMEQIRDHLAAGEDQLTDTIIRENQQMRRMAIPMVVLLGLILLVMIISALAR
ncbi:MAG: hypothetical protein ACOCZE_13330 [Planctomycetota bacterium]